MSQSVEQGWNLLGGMGKLIYGQVLGAVGYGATS
jgi:hypothetical protein